MASPAEVAGTSMPSCNRQGADNLLAAYYCYTVLPDFCYPVWELPLA
jgi:hypothetical protein